MIAKHRTNFLSFNFASTAHKLSATARTFPVLLAFLYTSLSHGQAIDLNISEVPRLDFPILSEGAYSLVAGDGNLFVGGSYYFVAPGQMETACVLDRLSGINDPGWPQVIGTISAVVPDGSGGYYVGGFFKSIGGLARTNLARILSTREVDPNWKPDPDGSVFAMALVETNLYIAGAFSNVGGQARKRLAALDPKTASVQAWNPDGPEQPLELIHAILVEEESLYFGGSFQSVGGQARSNLAAVDLSTGKATLWNPGTDNQVFAISSLHGSIFVAGNFNRVGGEFRGGVASVDPLFGSPTFWAPNFQLFPGEFIQTMAVFCDNIYLGGGFKQFGGMERTNAVAINATTGAILPWNPNPDDFVSELAIGGDTIYAAGFFTTIGGRNRPNLAGLDFFQGTATEWRPEADCPPANTLAVYGRSLFVGGIFSSAIGRRNGLASIETRTGAVTSWNPAAKDPVNILALAKLGSTIYAGGSFSRLAGEPHLNLGAVDAVTELPRPFAADANGAINALAIGNGSLYVGGNFTTLGGFFRNGVASVDLDNGATTEWNPIANGEVFALAARNDAVFVGGNFSMIGGWFHHGLAAIDPSTGLSYSWWDPAQGAEVVIYSMAIYGDALIVGGLFLEMGGAPRTSLAAIKISTGEVLDWNPQVNGFVNAMTISGDILFVGGLFNDVGGEPRNSLAAFDLTTGLLTSWRPVTEAAWVRSLAFADGSLYVAGNFVGFGNHLRPYLAAFSQALAPQIRRQPADQIIPVGGKIQVSAEITGSQSTFQWYRNGVALPGQVSPELAIENARVEDSGEYHLVAINNLGQAATARAKVTITDPARILNQSRNQTVAPGADVTLSVEVQGNPPPLFQWLLNGEIIPGAVFSSLQLRNVQATNSGLYSLVVFNSGAVVISESVELIVSAPVLPFGDNFESPGSITGLSGVGRGSNTQATREPGEPLHAGKRGRKSVWLEWTAPASGIATFHTRGSACDTLLAIYTGTALGSLTLVEEDDDQGKFFSSTVSFNAQADVSYRIALDGFSRESGNIVLSWDMDTVASDLPRILRQPVGVTVTRGETARFEVVLADPGSFTYQWFFMCDPIPGATSAALFVENIRPRNVGFYTVIIRNQAGRMVFSIPAALEIGPAAISNQSQDKFEDIFDDEAFTALGIKPAAAASFPIVAAGTFGSQNINNFNSTTQQGEPFHANTITGSSRWYKLTAADNGVFVLDTAGSDIDTVLAVYNPPEGTSLFELGNHVVAQDDNSAPDNLRSLVRFNAAKDAAYLTAVAGVRNAQGNILLNWKLGQAPAFTKPLANTNVPAGGTLSLTVEVTAQPAAEYRWFFNNQPLGVTTPTLTVGRFEASKAGLYRVEAFNFAGTNSTEANALLGTALRFNSANPPKILNGRIEMELSGGAAGKTFVIEASANFSAWLPVWTNTPGGSLLFSEPLQLDRRFYRALER